MFKRLSRIQSAPKGYTLIEMAVVVAVIGLLSAIAISNWFTSAEVRDANMVQSAQAALQQALSQGATRLDMSPATLMGNPRQRTNVINAVNLLMQNSPQVRITANGANFQLTINSTGRTATYQVDNSGNVVLPAGGLGGNWTQYAVVNGVITHN